MGPWYCLKPDFETYFLKPVLVTSLLPLAIVIAVVYSLIEANRWDVRIVVLITDRYTGYILLTIL